MRKINLYRWITNNYWIKLSCFLLAVLLWYSISGEVSIVRDFNISITIENIPKDLIVSAQSTRNIFISAQGDRRTILRCQATAFSLPIDLGDIKKPGIYSYDLLPDKVITPAGIKVISIKPRRLTLTLKKKCTT